MNDRDRGEIDLAELKRRHDEYKNRRRVQTMEQTKKDRGDDSRRGPMPDDAGSETTETVRVKSLFEDEELDLGDEELDDEPEESKPRFSFGAGLFRRRAARNSGRGESLDPEDEEEDLESDEAIEPAPEKGAKKESVPKTGTDAKKESAPKAEADTKKESAQKRTDMPEEEPGDEPEEVTGEDEEDLDGDTDGEELGDEEEEKGGKSGTKFLAWSIDESNPFYGFISEAKGLGKAAGLRIDRLRSKHGRKKEEPDMNDEYDDEPYEDTGAGDAETAGESGPRADGNGPAEEGGAGADGYDLGEEEIARKEPDEDGAPARKGAKGLFDKMLGGLKRQGREKADEDVSDDYGYDADNDEAGDEDEYESDEDYGETDEDYGEAGEDEPYDEEDDRPREKKPAFASFNLKGFMQRLTKREDKGAYDEDDYDDYGGSDEEGSAEDDAEEAMTGYEEAVPEETRGEVKVAENNEQTVNVEPVTAPVELGMSRRERREMLRRQQEEEAARLAALAQQEEQAAPEEPAEDTAAEDEAAPEAAPVAEGSSDGEVAAQVFGGEIVEETPSVTDETDEEDDLFGFGPDESEPEPEPAPSQEPEETPQPEPVIPVQEPETVAGSIFDDSSMGNMEEIVKNDEDPTRKYTPVRRNAPEAAKEEEPEDEEDEEEEEEKPRRGLFGRKKKKERPVIDDDEDEDEEEIEEDDEEEEEDERPSRRKDRRSRRNDDEDDDDEDEKPRRGRRKADDDDDDDEEEEDEKPRRRRRRRDDDEDEDEEEIKKPRRRRKADDEDDEDDDDDDDDEDLDDIDYEDYDYDDEDGAGHGAAYHLSGVLKVLCGIVIVLLVAVLALNVWDYIGNSQGKDSPVDALRSSVRDYAPGVFDVLFPLSGDTEAVEDTAETAQQPVLDEGDGWEDENTDEGGAAANAG